MATTDVAFRLAPYIEQLLEDEAARENLRRGATTLQEAYTRSKKPKRRRRRLLAFLSLGAIGAGVALALSDDLRSSLLGGSSASQQPSADGDPR